MIFLGVRAWKASAADSVIITSGGYSVANNYTDTFSVSGTAPSSFQPTRVFFYGNAMNNGGICANYGPCFWYAKLLDNTTGASTTSPNVNLGYSPGFVELDFSNSININSGDSYTLTLNIPYPAASSNGGSAVYYTGSFPSGVYYEIFGALIPEYYVSLFTSEHPAANPTYDFDNWSYYLQFSTSSALSCPNGTDSATINTYYTASPITYVTSTGQIYSSSTIYQDSLNFIPGANCGLQGASFNKSQPLTVGDWYTLSQIYYPSSGPVADAINTTSFTVLSSASTTPSIYLQFPTASTTQDFDNWQVTFNDGTAPKIEVVYFASSTPLFIDTAYPLSPQMTLYQIPKSNLLPNGTYTAYANLYSGTTYETSTPEMSFTITSSTANQYYTAPSSTSTALTITCDPHSGFFQYSFCYLFQYLFYPAPASINQFGNIKGLVWNKPPIGWFNQITSALSFNTSTAPDVVLMSTTTAANLQPFFGAIDPVGGYSVFIVVGFWFFHKFRHFQL